MGIYPVVVPRRAKRAEHVDDHQLQIASLVKDRGISLVTEVESLNRSAILHASANAITKQVVDVDSTR
jgi:UDP-N-acetylglucosamine transferase subunit ALG13